MNKGYTVLKHHTEEKISPILVALIILFIPLLIFAICMKEIYTYAILVSDILLVLCWSFLFPHSNEHFEVYTIQLDEHTNIKDLMDKFEFIEKYSIDTYRVKEKKR